MSEAVPDEKRIYPSREDALRYGEPRAVVGNVSAVNAELRWALQNALERIAVLEEAVNSLHRELRTVTEPVR